MVFSTRLLLAKRWETSNRPLIVMRIGIAVSGCACCLYVCVCASCVLSVCICTYKYTCIHTYIPSYACKCRFHFYQLIYTYIYIYISSAYVHVNVYVNKGLVYAISSMTMTIPHTQHTHCAVRGSLVMVTEFYEENCQASLAPTCRQSI